MLLCGDIYGSGKWLAGFDWQEEQSRVQRLCARVLLFRFKFSVHNHCVDEDPFPLFSACMQPPLRTKSSSPAAAARTRTHPSPTAPVKAP